MPQSLLHHRYRALDDDGEHDNNDRIISSSSTSSSIISNKKQQRLNHNPFTSHEIKTANNYFKLLTISATVLLVLWLLFSAYLFGTWVGRHEDQQSHVVVGSQNDILIVRLPEGSDAALMPKPLSQQQRDLVMTTEQQHGDNKDGADSKKKEKAKLPRLGQEIQQQSKEASPDIKSKDEAEVLNKNQSLGAQYSNPSILRNGCSLTVVLLDPRLPLYNPDLHSAYWSLESIMANVPPSTTCLLLQTSSCHPTFHNSLSNVYSAIYSKSHPILRSFIHRGQVRVSIIDHELYRFKSCRDWNPPNGALMHVEYWGPREFVPEDADMVLMVQDDALLCQPFDPERWRDVAYVGAPWPPRANMYNNPIPEDGTCRFLPEKWGNYTGEEGRERMRLQWMRGGMQAYKYPPPDPITPSYNLSVISPIPLSFPPICTPPHAPIGNGGLTIRSRSWLRRAIATCPHVQHSGLAVNPACAVYANVPEDLYYGTVLRGLGAPYPTGFEASLFSTEMMLPEVVASHYGPEGEEEREMLVKKRWARMKGMTTKENGDYNNNDDDDDDDPLERYRRMKREGIVIPIGWHKPWWYHNETILLGDQMKKECPYAERMLSMHLKRHRMEAERARRVKQNQRKRQKRLKEERQHQNEVDIKVVRLSEMKAKEKKIQEAKQRHFEWESLNKN